jgi:phosphatidylserine decarboxylase
MLIPLLISGGLLGGALVLARWFRKTGYILSGIFLGVMLLLLFFARNPARSIPEGDDLIVAPADGRIVTVQSSDSTTRIAIFLSLTDVHVNRIPCDGKVVSVHHIDGKFRPAFSTNAGGENERVRTHIQNPDGDVILTQIAGMVARRIVCRLSEGQEVRRGEVFGMIKLGSRVELELPVGVQIRVSVGDRVRAGETVIGRFIHGV